MKPGYLISREVGKRIRKIISKFRCLAKTASILHEWQKESKNSLKNCN